MTEYIDREAVYEDFEKCNGKNTKWTPSRVKTIIARQKSADVAPVRRGRWIPEEHEDRVSPTMTHRYRWYHCSLCGRRLIGYSNPKDAPYCHCGAKMNEEATDNG